MSMKEAEENKDELKDFPILHSIGRNFQYHAPEKYFEKLGDALQQRTSAPVKKPIFLAMIRPVLAGTLTLLFILGVWLFSGLQTKTADHTTASLQQTIAVEEIIESGYYLELDETLLTDALIETGTVEAPDDDKELEDYLIHSTYEEELTTAL